MGPLGMGEIVVLFIVALLVFGPKKLPELGKTFGKGMAEFKRASNELKTTFQREMDNIEHETKDVKGLAKDVTKDINKDISTSYYDDYEDDYYSDYDYGTDKKESNPSADGAAADSADESSASSAAETETATTDGPASSGEPAPSGDVQEASGEPVSGLPEAESVATSKPA